MTVMQNERLQYYIHDDSDALRLELSGSLSGEGALSVYHAWRTALSIVGERLVTADISYVTDADEGGRILLRLWHRHGVRIRAANAQSCALAESILGEPFEVPATPPRTGWFRRLTAALRGRWAFAAAGNRSAEFTPVSNRRQLEYHVR